MKTLFSDKNVNLSVQLADAILLSCWSCFLNRYTRLSDEVCLSSPATSATPRASPMVEYVKDITAATMESHQTWSKSGIWENSISMIPNVIIYPLLDM